MTTLWNAPVEDVRRALAYAAVRKKNPPPIRQIEPPAFASEAHERFYRSEAPELVASAWMGAGKSRVLCQKAWDLARAYPGATLGLFRKIAASLPATTERTFWRDVVDPSWIAARNKSENWVELTNGSRIYFMGLDPDPITGVPSKVGSLDLDWAGVDEAVEITEGDWIMLGGRLRRTAMPYRQLAAATNPASPQHWLKRHFTPPTETREWVAISANRFLPDDYKARLTTLGTGAIADRLARGLWVAAEGAIWMLPDGQIRSEPGPWKRIVAGIDWGYVHAFACEVIGQTGSGRLSVIDEVYHRGRTLGEVIPALKIVHEQHKIDTFYADPSEPAYIAECRAAGLPMKEARNDVLPGINSVTEAIASGLTVAPSCAGLLGEIPGYTWQTNRLGLQEKPVEVGDDACDALRYAVFALSAAQTGWGAVTGSAGGIA